MLSLSFTEYELSGEILYQNGWIMISLVSVLIAVNVFIQLAITFHALKRNARLYYFRLKKKFIKSSVKPAPVEVK
jgi:hypothetical protein